MIIGKKTLFSFVIPTVISAYYVLNSVAVCVTILVTCIILRGIKIWSLERKIKNGTYGYYMDAIVNTTHIGIASMAGVFGFRIFVNLETIEAFSIAFNLIIIWLVFIVLLIVFMIEHIDPKAPDGDDGSDLFFRFEKRM